MPCKIFYISHQFYWGFFSSIINVCTKTPSQKKPIIDHPARARQCALRPPAQVCCACARPNPVYNPKPATEGCFSTATLLH